MKEVPLAFWAVLVTLVIAIIAVFIIICDYEPVEAQNFDDSRSFINSYQADGPVK